MLSVKTHQFAVHLFPFSDEKEIDKIGQRFRIAGAGAACHHKVFKALSLCGQQRNAGQIKHIEHIGIAQFILQSETDDVKL